ncbi:AAA family ATPase [uncultured Desulfobacter sp.]|uniref:ATP-binding protein n=1 Tax=uncultured Desulfobacter sp. TaxID=240139 RepID=UPI0029C89718|nr:AAA family ATPase [uncultured Desulfobacter sp.]
MPHTVHIRQVIPPKERSGALDLRNWIMGLLAGMLPPDQQKEPSQPEAAYLMHAVPSKPHRRLNLNDIVQNSHTGEKNLIRLLGTAQPDGSDIIALTLCYLVETDPMAGRCMAYLQQPMGGSRPTLSLLAAIIRDSGIFPGDNMAHIMAHIVHGKAVALGLLQVLNEASPLPEQQVRLHTPVALNVSGGRFSWPGTRIIGDDDGFELPQSLARQADLQARSLAQGSRDVLVIRSPSIREKRRAARHIAFALKKTALMVEDQEKAFPGLGTICIQKGLLPVLIYECGPGDQINLPEITGYQGPVLVIAGHEGAFESNVGQVIGWTIPLPTHEERKSLWDKHLGRSELSEQLAWDHIHGMDRIIELAGLAKRQSIIYQKDTVGMEEIREAAWLRENRGLSAMAQPVKAKVTDKTLVVRPRTQRQLDLLEQRCRMREQLVDDLGITLKARYEMGVKALFTGPSGTGKTLAASWLANRLSAPLYRVDLASITSKYIGETEKNLARLLGQSEQEDVVLLFDEADSLFGKRTDVKDANDRFANAQTNYLLQRIETYTGVVLLTSNSKARFDAAFTRRLDMIIDFPLPNPKERRAIWLNHLGSFHTLSKGNINQLAMQCELSGGNIRNVVLTAAVMAKSKQTSISFKTVIDALSDEYRKIGKQLSPELKRVRGPYTSNAE